MQLKYDKQIANKVITISLETTSFTPKEIQAINDYGDPAVVLNKTYDGNFVVAISKKLQSGFKFTQKFDGRTDLQKAIEAAETFYSDIKDVLNQTMSDLMDIATSNTYPEGSGIDDITNF